MSIWGQKTTNLAHQFLIVNKNSENAFLENSGAFEICVGVIATEKDDSEQKNLGHLVVRK
jgi:hypothetical protein